MNDYTKQSGKHKYGQEDSEGAGKPSFPFGARKVPESEKLAIPANIMDLITTITTDIQQVVAALGSANQGNWGKAIMELFTVVQGIIVNLILPAIKKSST